MKTLKIVLAIALAVAGSVAAESAFAHRGRVVVGVGLGFGFPYYAYGPYYPHYYPYYYPPYYPAPVVVQQQPSVYVEQPQVQQSPQPSGYWYYCADARAYYPYVKECPAGWQRVAPQPQN